jgi:outer membrane immunogenic protein
VPVRNKIILLLLAAGVAPAAAQGVSESPGASTRPEVALSYAWVDANAPPGSCGCFGLNGGGASLAWPIKSWTLSLVLDAIVAETPSAQEEGKSYSLTLSTVTLGARYYPQLQLGRFAPFSEALVGVAHASGTLMESPNPGAANAAAAFAAQLGGGVDLNLTPGLAVRLIEADYLLTTFDNGSNNHQNNVRLGAGLIFRF